MKSGFHGSNGVGPKVSLKIYQSYIIPRLLDGMEVLNLNKTEIQMLTDFHVNLLRRIQSLPTRTALPAVYLLLGVTTSDRTPQETSQSPLLDTGPDSIMVRASASEAGGAGSNPGPGRVIPKTLKWYQWLHS